MSAPEQITVSANGVDFTALAMGDGPLALCLHGFPDSAHGWRHLLPRLAEAGYRAVAPFQRGYAPTSVPADGLFQSGVLGVDANALHEALGGDGRAVIIGHDWGASGTHAAAVLAPERWRKVVTMAVPPGGAIGMSFLTNLAQIKRSWYMFFFQHPLSDMVVPGNDLAFIDMLWADWSPGHDATEDLVHVKNSLRDPANLTAALGYYRATLGAGLRDASLDAAQAATSEVPPQPTLYLHGRNDGCIGVEVAELAAATAPPQLTVEVVDGAGHFLHLERPEVVNARILEFLA
ncbi:MAG: alpha/beta hydrolase [Acidobacteria bacterium]|nr:alpha/beta hydrolase [Acidobacteriota bacterium]